MGQKPSHRIAILLFQKWLLTLFDSLRIQSEGPIAIPIPDGIYSEPEPDIAVTREPTTTYSDRHPGPADLLFVADVADTTLKTDLLVKAKLYARAGIPEFWTLDLTARLLHIHRAALDGEYTEITVHGESASVALALQPMSVIKVSDLLPPVVAD
jgi:Uma2 family endonuclease